MSEILFIGGMFVLIFIICTVAVVFFVQTYRKEQREKIQRKTENAKLKTEKVE
jgi:cbb3-type cytochrome oxidase subunit 3